MVQNMEEESKTPFLPGMKVTRKNGTEGVFIGVEEEEGKTYGVVEFSDGMTSKVPFTNFGKIYTSVKENNPIEIQRKCDLQAEAAKIEKIPIIHKSVLDDPKEIDTDDVELVIKLREYIREAQSYSLRTFPSTVTPELQVKLAQVLHFAKVFDCVFRGEGRHPFAKGQLDQKRKVRKGPFEEGFNRFKKSSPVDYGYDDFYISGLTFTTADLEFCLTFPEAEMMPSDWDKVATYYVIKPTACLKNLGDIRDDLDEMTVNLRKESELGMKRIEPEDIAFAIVIDWEKQQVSEILENEHAGIKLDNY